MSRIDAHSLGAFAKVLLVTVATFLDAGVGFGLLVAAFQPASPTTMEPLVSTVAHPSNSSSVKVATW
jgi:predicted alpha/beta hydrolase family esterase